MIRQCFACVLLVLPFIVEADPIIKGELGSLGEKKTLQLFEHFGTKYGRNYGHEEYLKRFKVFKQNLETIDRLNREEKGTAKYGITRFADLTFEEFTRNFTGGRLSEEAWASHEAQMEEDADHEIEFVDDVASYADLSEKYSAESLEGLEEEYEMALADGKVYIPKKFDYRKKKAVTPVKDQGSCGSCWAFSAMCNIEGVYAKKHKKLFDLAEQELLDCDKVDQGCMGGWMQDAVKELVRIGGIAKTSDYPYRGREESCKYKASMAAVKVAGTKSIPANEKKMAKALVKNGPLSIAVVASSNFQFYESGIFDPTPSQCSNNKNNVNHGVTLVGYAEENKSGKKLPFWVIKNSWGSRWGDKGYMQIVRGKNACAVSSFVSTAFL